MADAHVLVVDDEKDVANVTALHLERRFDNCTVTTAGNGREALSVIEASEVECIVSDYEMPQMDGLDLLHELQRRDDAIPFILYTGRGSEEIASKAISAGVTDYLQKRATSDQYDVLANRIENAVGRHRSELVREETEHRYRNLVEASPHAIVVYRRSHIIYANESVVDLLGFDGRAEIYDAQPLDYVHPDDHDRVAARMQRTTKNREKTGWLSWKLTRADGEVRHVESRGTPVTYDGQPAVQVVMQDVTERRQRERRLEALNHATRDLLTADSPERVAETALRVIESAFGESFATMWTYRPDTGILERLAVTDAATERTRDVAGDSGAANPSGDDLEMQVFQSGEPRLVEGYADHEDAMTTAFETVYMIPLDTHGLLSVASVDAEAFSDTDRDLLGILARSVVVALDRVAE